MVTIKPTGLCRETQKCELCSIGLHLLFTFSSSLNSYLKLGLDLLHSIPYVEASLCSSVLCQALCLVYLSVRPLVCQSVCWSILAVCLSVCPSACPSIDLSICLLVHPLCLSVRLSVFLSVSLRALGIFVHEAVCEHKGTLFKSRFFFVEFACSPCVFCVSFLRALPLSKDMETGIRLN